MFARSVQLLFLIVVIAMASGSGRAQTASREFTAEPGTWIENTNPNGRVDASAAADATGGRVTATGDVGGDEILKIESSRGRTQITVEAARDRRIDISVRIPERTRVRITTGEGEIMAVGNFERLEAESNTGTIAVDVPTGDLK